MSVTVKFAERMKPPTAVNPQPSLTEVPDKTFAEAFDIGVKEGWLLVTASSGMVLGAFCPGSVISATVDQQPACTDEVPAAVDPTEALPTGSAAMDAANAGAGLVGAGGRPLTAADFDSSAAG